MLIQIKIAIMVAVLALSNLGTYKYVTYKHKAEQLDVLEDVVDDHNQDIKEIEEHEKLTETTRIEYRDKIIQLPPIVIDPGCPLDPSTGLRNEVTSNLPDLYFQSSNVMPAATD